MIKKKQYEIKYEHSETFARFVGIEKTRKRVGTIYSENFCSAISDTYNEIGDNINILSVKELPEEIDEWSEPDPFDSY